jgi:hypothetical protein
MTLQAITSSSFYKFWPEVLSFLQFCLISAEAFQTPTLKRHANVWLVLNDNEAREEDLTFEAKGIIISDTISHWPSTSTPVHRGRKIIHLQRDCVLSVWECTQTSKMPQTCHQLSNTFRNNHCKNKSFCEKTTKTSWISLFMCRHIIIMHWIYIALFPRHSKTLYIERGDLTHHHQCVAPTRGGCYITKRLCFCVFQLIHNFPKHVCTKSAVTPLINLSVYLCGEQPGHSSSGLNCVNPIGMLTCCWNSATGGECATR